MTDFASLGSSPHVAVAPHAKVDGIYALAEADTVPAIDVVPLVDAFSREWLCDAHFVGHLLSSWMPGHPYWRLNKTKGLLAEIRAVSAAQGDPEDVHVRVIAIDWDTGRKPNHFLWTEAPHLWAPFDAARRKATADPTPFGALLRAAAYAYATRGGFRWVFVLSKPLPADDAEPFIRGVVGMFHAAGFAVDELCDWTRLFRLPRVTRDGTKTSASPFFLIEEHPERRLDVGAVVPVGRPEVIQTQAESGGPRPHDDEVEILLWRRNERGAPVYSEFYKTMKRQFQGQPYFPYIFEMRPLDIPEGQRHDTIQSWISSAVGAIIRTVPDATINHLYSLFYMVGAQIEGRDGRQETWRSCVWSWGKEAAAAEQEKKAKEVEQKKVEAKKLEGAERIIVGVRRWFPLLPLDPPTAWAWVKKRMILKEKRAGRYFVLRQDGLYSADPVDAGSLVPQIIQQGMSEHIPTAVDGKQGPRPIETKELALSFVTNVAQVKYKCEIEGSYLEDVGNEESPSLVALSFRRNPRLSPCYSPDVDLWLKSLGGDQYEMLCRHIGCFLAWERGCVAIMSFALPQGAGKNLFTDGLEETLEDPRSSTGEDLVNRFNSKLQFSPFIFMNEGLSEENTTYHVADALRRVTTANVINHEKKGRDAENIRFPFRVVLTANGWCLIDMIGNRKDLTPYEREALGLRLVHYMPKHPRAATDLLASKGGERWTRGWVRGAAGEPSRYVVARHFLWLWEQHGKNAEVQGKGRLLVEGDPNQPAMQRLRTQGGATPVVVELLLKVFGSRNPGLTLDGSAGILAEGGRLWVTEGALLAFARDHMPREKISPGRLRAALKGLTVGDESGVDGDTLKKPTNLIKTSSKHGIKARWREIDVLALAHEAAGVGVVPEKLNDLVEVLRAKAGSTNGTHASTPSGRLLAMPGGA